MSKNNEGQTYEQWYALLDKCFTRQFGLGVDDFPDYMWFDEFESDCTPEDSFLEWMAQTNGGYGA